MRPPSNPEPPRPCPICQVAMQTSETAHSIVHQCARCGVVITVGKPEKGNPTMFHEGDHP
jgi:Zn-finger nucleic acid-binding protein